MNQPDLIESRPTIDNLRSLLKLSQVPGFVWLDSASGFDVKDSTSHLATKPAIDLILGDPDVSGPEGANRITCDSIDSFLRELDRLTNDSGLAAYGYFGYESTLALLGLCSLAPRTSDLDFVPEARFLCFQQFSQATNREPGPHWPRSGPSVGKDEKGKIISEPDRDEYESRVLEIKQHILEGDIYQANYTTRYEIASDQNPFDVYTNLRQLNRAAYGAYMNFGDYQIISSSPERMFKRRGSRVVASPIKGTIRRGRSDEETRSNLQSLINSEKDKAELLMIVDLSRNDLGKIALTGSVKVEELFRAEIHPSLIHLVSDISAELPEQMRYSPLVGALLPGGSITGAPKRRAVEILQNLEQCRRNVYTGCIGYIHGDRSEFNVAIRTILHRNGEYHVHAGGGIVADSLPEAEFMEMQLKARNLLRAVGVTPEETNQ